ncbi:MAG: hypothetical protein WC959_04695 [Kiritimatiellales bacterium]
MDNDVFISPEVDLKRISPTAVFYPGCRIYGEKTSIGPDCILGAEAPLTLNNCQLGRTVKLKGGWCSGSVFFNGTSLGSGAHVREGTIMEENSAGAHTVGLKQTVLFPFVQLGSLVNFCDVLMAGGTGSKNHSEVGSSYIHFNFTPHQDKATASLVGDVPRGVLLDQQPVFLGGQGGLAGPARIAYGTVIPAGTVCRKDVLEENTLYVPEPLAPQRAPYNHGVYKDIRRLIYNNLTYIGNMYALMAWYQGVRMLFVRDDFDRAVITGALKNLDLILGERLNRLEQLAGKMNYSIEKLKDSGAEFAALVEQQQAFSGAWSRLRIKIETLETPAAGPVLLREIEAAGKDTYIAAITNLTADARADAAGWLQPIVDQVTGLWSFSNNE